MAKVLSSISGNLISAASAGYAPTNGADVSAIASAYQVVSATGTQTYAGTAYVTSLNSAPVSAERAGNAANAALANSAWYDGTGRFISALPDSAAVSAIASAYASGKQDSSAMSAYALSSDVSGVIDTVSGNSASWGGGATGDYVEKSAIAVNIGSSNTVNRSAFARGYSNTADFWSLADGLGNSATGYSITQGSYNKAGSWACSLGTYNSASINGLSQGNYNRANSDAFAQGEYNTADINSLAQGQYNSASTMSLAQGVHNTAAQYSVALGRKNSAIHTAVVIGEYNLKGNGSADNVAFTIGNGTGVDARHDLLNITKNGEITVYSSTADATGIGLVSSITSLSADVSGVIDTVSGNSASWGGGGGITLTTATARKQNSNGQLVAFTGVASADSKPLIAQTIQAGAVQSIGTANFFYGPSRQPFTANTAGIYSPLQYATGACLAMDGGTYRAYYKGNEWFISDYGMGRSGAVRAEVHSNRGIHISGSNTAGVGFDLLTTGLKFADNTGTTSMTPANIDEWKSCNSTVSANSAAWGETAYIPLSSTSIEMTSTAYSASYNLESIDLFVKDADSSNVLIEPAGISFKSGNGTNIGFVDPYHIGNWDGVYNTVSNQSANWGGSALALSAGPGVRLYKTGDTLVAGLDETVLWSGNATNITGITLNETYGNFDRVRFYWKPWSDTVAWHVTEIPSFASIFTLDAGWATNAGTGKALFVYSISSNGTAFSQLQGGFQNITGSNTWTSSTNCDVAKVVGINRTAGV